MQSPGPHTGDTKMIKIHKIYCILVPLSDGDNLHCVRSCASCVFRHRLHSSMG